MAKADLEQIVLDEDTIVQMATLWADANAATFDEAGLGVEDDGWTGDPPEDLDQIAQDAAADIVDQLRHPDDGSAGMVVMNEIDSIADTLYFAFAEMTAASEEDFDAWFESLEDEVEDSDEAEDDLGDVGDPGDEPEVDDEA